MKLYHIAGAKYQAGDDLLCWNELEQHGIASADDWQWEEAPIGFDGDVVCLYEDRGEALEHQVEHGGQLLVLDGERIIHGNDYTEPLATVRVAEGYLAVYGRIPATYIMVVAACC